MGKCGLEEVYLHPDIGIYYQLKLVDLKIQLVQFLSTCGICLIGYVFEVLHWAFMKIQHMNLNAHLFTSTLGLRLLGSVSEVTVVLGRLEISQVFTGCIGSDCFERFIHFGLSSKVTS